MLSDYCDAVVMLTWSHWRTEMRSNRYHYAERFAEHLPVLLVRPDLKDCRREFEETELPNVTILHVGQDYVPDQAVELRRALAQREIHNPLLWICNSRFSDFILSTCAPIKVYHATEDDFREDVPDTVVDPLRRVLDGCDLLVSASEAVQESHLQAGGFRGASLVVGQGHDAPEVRRIVEKIEKCISSPDTTADPRNVIVLYDEKQTHVNTINEHLHSFGMYSRHNVHFAPAVGDAQCALDLSLFDAVVVHYSVRVCLPDHHMSPSYAQALREFKGLKIQMLQDEYDTTSTAWTWIRQMGIHVVYTSVPREYVATVYPGEKFPHTEFIGNLTGYAPIRLEKRTRAKPMGRRTYVLGYRGRKLPYWYGKLGQEKLTIGINVKRICHERDIPCNIEWADEHRLYGQAWYDFTEDCRAVLGTESGANVFDFDGTLRGNITRAIEEDPDLTFEEAFERFLRDREGEVVMNQVSPRIFEAIALRTALVLFEGTYSGVIRPDEHYIPLKKDYSNVDDVLAKLEDIDYLEAMTARAHRDIIASGAYSYRAFIRGFDDVLSRKLRKGPGRLLVSMPVAARPCGDALTAIGHVRKPRGSLPTNVVLPMPLKEFQEDLSPATRPDYRQAARYFHDPAAGLGARCDAVVMLTWSDWATEMRSNRYHYAKRFADHLPVLFVQPDLKRSAHRFEQTELPNVTVLHVGQSYTLEQAAELRRALAEREIHNPLLWIYNYLFSDFILSTYAPIKVYHATEDYFCRDFHPAFAVKQLRDVLAGCDMLVSVSEGVQENYLRQGRFRGRSLVATNGCDFEQWAGCADSPDRGKYGKVALYQGGINRKVDFAMLLAAARALPDWQFRFCGVVALEPADGLDQWKALRGLRNIEYLGKLGPDKLRDCMSRATVGLIPFVQNDWIVERSFPLKAFEYLACGLPVVTVPIRALEPYADLFVHVRTAEELAPAIERAATEYATPERVEAGLAAAKAQDYGLKFQRVVETIQECVTTVETAATRRNVLILYDENSTHVNTLKEHLDSFGTYSCHSVHYAPATGAARCVLDLSLFDAVVVHYSVRVNLSDHHMSESYARAVREFKGLKILFIQDEYDTTGTAWEWIRKMGLHVVYTCVPHDYVTTAYPPEMFPRTEFIENLTGYVPTGMEHRKRAKPLDQRTYVLGYRGRELPYWYGKLGREKFMIGVDMKRICTERGIPCNIEWEHQHRIYGPGWYDFIEDCRAALGTESGANVFDFDGTLSRDITAALEEDPDLTFDEAFERFLGDHEGKVVMNQISPKIFEAIALRTALVLFEGGYSGVVRPEEHFIPLKKDYSNVDDVLARLADFDYLTELTDRAHRDVIASGWYSYRAFIRDFDDLLARKLRKGPDKLLLSTIVSARPSGGKLQTLCHSRPLGELPTDTVLPVPLAEFREKLGPAEDLSPIRRYWRELPDPIRWPIHLYLWFWHYWIRLPKAVRLPVKLALKPPIWLARKTARSAMSRLGFDRHDVRVTLRLLKRGAGDPRTGPRLGWAWTMLNPLLLLLAVGTFVFALACTTTWGPQNATLAYAIWLIGGAVPYLAGAEALIAAAGSVVSARKAVKAGALKSELLPIAATLGSAVLCAVGVVLLLLMMCVGGQVPTWHVVMLIPVMILQFTFLAGLGMFLAAAAVFVRDVPRVAAVLALLILFFTPVFYGIEQLPAGLQKVTFLNPFHHIVEAYRSVLVRHEMPHAGGMAYLAGLAVVFFLCGLKYFRRLKGHFEMAL